MSERDRAVKPFQERALVRSSPNTSRNCPSEGSLTATKFRAATPVTTRHR